MTTNYDFRSLSPIDFELLSRDLLQKTIGVRLESFSAGPDSGIDFRHRTDSENLIVQCKHYVESGFTRLRRTLEQKELPKLQKLDPTRYILATSVPLTPARKEDLMRVLHRYCRNVGDIFGCHDINNLLTEHTDVEHKHYKLWLTSVSTLQRVIYSGVFSDSDAVLERIRMKLARYVPNKSFHRAKTYLEDRHFCIIAGIPGIGKTTLAEVLLADLVDHHGFTPLRIAHDLGELRSIKNRKLKQVFYFDDFLGTTSLERLQRNEDQRLVELMEEVASNDNWRLILTTREYILNSARQRYEAFEYPSIDFALCIVGLQDYTRPIRARILYNHIYFSDLPREYKLALLGKRDYESIISHRNYSPRIVDYMTQQRHARSVGQADYRQEFLDSLDNPERIWKHAFRHHISEAGRHLLLVLVTLRHETRLEDLETAFWALYTYRSHRMAFSTAGGDFDEAMNDLDGNFVGTEKIGQDVLVSFHNPSVRDFMEHFLAGASDPYVLDLVDCAKFFEQYVALWRGVGGRRYGAIERAGNKFINALGANLFGPSACAIRRGDGQGEIVGVGVYPPSKESRVQFLIEVAETWKGGVGERWVESSLDSLYECWRKGLADREDLFKLLKALSKSRSDWRRVAVAAARPCLLDGAERLEHFRVAVDFLEAYPGQAADDERQKLAVSFSRFMEEGRAEWDDADPDELRWAGEEVEHIGQKLNVHTGGMRDSLYERAEEIEGERTPERGAEEVGEGWSAPMEQTENVEGMFEGLRSDLMDDG